MEPSLPQLHPEHARLLNEAREEVILYVNKTFEKFFNTISFRGTGGDSLGDSLPPQPVSIGGPGKNDEFEFEEEETPLDLSTNNSQRAPIRYDGATELNSTESSSTTTATVPVFGGNLSQQLCNGGDQSCASSKDSHAYAGNGILSHPESRFVGNCNASTVTCNEVETTLMQLDVKDEIDGQLVRQIEIGDSHDLFNVSTEPCQCDECLAQLCYSHERDVINGNSSQLGVKFEGESAFAQQNLTSPMPTKTDEMNNNNNNDDCLERVEPALEESVLDQNPSNSIESQSPLVPPAPTQQQQLSRQTSASETSNVSATIPSTSSSKQIKRKVSNDQSRTEASKSDRSNKKQRSDVANESSSTKSKETRSTQPRKVSSKSSSDHSSSSSSQLSGRSDKRPEVKIKIRDKVSKDRRSSLDRRTYSSSSRSKAREEKGDSVRNGDATKAKATDSYRKDSSSSRKEPKSSWDQRGGVGGRARERRSSADHQRTSRRSPSPPPPPKAHNAVVKYSVISFKCRKCHLTFERTTPLEDHEFKHHQLKPLPCFFFDCDDSFYQKGQLLEHVRRHHCNDVDWKCKHCGRVCHSGYQLESHIALEHRMGIFGCTVAGCGHRAQCRKDALRHYEKEHYSPDMTQGRRSVDSEDSKYKVTMIKCPLPECHRYFTETNQMEEHLMTAHGRKPIACIGPGCESSFSERSHMSQHIEAVHPEVKRWLCSVSGCDFGTANQEQMCLHQVRFHQEGRFRCAQPNCEFVDKYRDAIIRHFDRAHRLAEIH